MGRLNMYFCISKIIHNSIWDRSRQQAKAEEQTMRCYCLWSCMQHFSRIVTQSISFHFVRTSTGRHRQCVRAMSTFTSTIYSLCFCHAKCSTLLLITQGRCKFCINCRQYNWLWPDRIGLMAVNILCECAEHALVLYFLLNEVNTRAHLHTTTILLCVLSVIQRCRFGGQFMHVATVYTKRGVERTVPKRVGDNGETAMPMTSVTDATQFHLILLLSTHIFYGNNKYRECFCEMRFDFHLYTFCIHFAVCVCYFVIFVLFRRSPARDILSRKSKYANLSDNTIASSSNANVRHALAYSEW